MPQKHLIQPQPKDRLDLKTLPDFMKAPSPQVKFHSAFPPLTTKVRVRSVMERAGFDVYKPEKGSSNHGSAHNSMYKGNKNSSSSINASGNASFMPPSKMFPKSRSTSPQSPQSQSRSFSHNPNHSAPKLSDFTNKDSDDISDVFHFTNPAQKGRNFTTAPNYINSTSTPNLLKSNHSPTHSNVEVANGDKMIDYARQNLGSIYQSEEVPPPTEVQESENIGQFSKPILPEINLPESANNTMDSDIPNLTNDIADSSVIINRNMNNYSDEDTDEYDPYEEEPDPFKESAKLPNRVVPRLSGPRPLQNSDDDLVSHESDPYEDAQQNFLHVEENPKSQRLSAMSANSVGSFDDRFMIAAEEADHYDEVSEGESFGGLTSMRKLVKSTEVTDLHAITPNIGDPYEENAKRLSTLGNSDTRIYNLESLQDDNSNDHDHDKHQYKEMSMIQEGEVEDSIIHQSEVAADSNEIQAIVPDLVLNHEHEIESDNNEHNGLDTEETYSDGEHTQGLNLADTSNQIPIISVESDSSNPFIDGNTSTSVDIDTESPLEEKNYDSNENHDDINRIEDEKLLEKGFLKRRASTRSTRTIPQHEHTVSPSLPVLPIIQGPDGISNLINGIETFQINDTMTSLENTTTDDIKIPPRHFEKENHVSISSVSDSDNDVFTPNVSKHHPYSILSGERKTDSMDSAAGAKNLSSALTTPDHENYPDAISRKSIYDAIESPYHQHQQHSQRNNMEGDGDIPKSINEDFKNQTEDQQQEVYYPAGEGPCRNCKKSIGDNEKKIWSKDQQMSGQWHRKCFGCQTCGQKFSKGSSCYVFNDQPYCETHFHELNGSLCQVCNKGVEGECLQNDVNEAFHIDCLKCVICGFNVDGDYFVFRDEVMCEEDAKELMHQIEEAEKDYKNQDVDKMIKRRTRVLYL